MTIRPHINAREMNERLNLLDRAVERAPEGTFEDAKALRALIGETADNLIAQVRALGFEANNSDGIREVEAVVYGWIIDANPESPTFAAAEGFGEHVDGPAGDRIIAGIARDRDFLRSIGRLPPRSGSMPNWQTTHYIRRNLAGEIVDWTNTGEQARLCCDCRREGGSVIGVADPISGLPHFGWHSFQPAPDAV